LTSAGLIQEEDYQAMKKAAQDKFQAAYNTLKEASLTGISELKMPEALINSIDHYETAIPLEDLKTLNADLVQRPEGFKGLTSLERVFKRRVNILEEGHKAEWGEGEALAFASILKDGIPIRITGQDSERGTFAHRHLVLYDTETGE